MTVEQARAVADAILYEGYLLYPYRASSGKNQVRWQFGVVSPAGAAADGVGEEASIRTECLLEADAAATLDVRVRFLQLQSRRVEQAVGGGFVPVPELRVGARRWLAWDEAVAREVTAPEVSVAAMLAGGRTVPVEIEGGADVELVHGEDGSLAGRLIRTRQSVSGRLDLSATAATAGRPLLRVRARLENTTAWTSGGSRDDAIAVSYLGAHLLLAVRGGAFVSLLDPPAWAAEAAAACSQRRCWPVLVGTEGDRDVVLAAPIILYDYPAVAAESPGDLFDATEIDEILTLRVMTMTDEEKSEARATDPLAGAILDRCDDMTPEVFGGLHGAGRVLPDSSPGEPAAEPVPEAPWWDPVAEASVSPDTDVVEIAGVPVGRGSHVRLHPSHRADAHDLFFAGQAARVIGVHSDVDGNVHVAVLLLDDPASELLEEYGRSLYFGVDEVEPLDARLDPRQ